MATELWVMPAAPTSLLTGPVFTPLAKRECEISFATEGEEGEAIGIRLRFGGVEAYKCTYMTSCSAEMVEAAYGKLVDLGVTPWLAELLERYHKYHEAAQRPAQRLQHLMICFDDGPCYEIICTHFGMG